MTSTYECQTCGKRETIHGVLPSMALCHWSFTKSSCYGKLWLVSQKVSGDLSEAAKAHLLETVKP